MNIDLIILKLVDLISTEYQLKQFVDFERNIHKIEISKT